MKLDLTKYRHYMVPILKRKFGQCEGDMTKFYKFLHDFSASPSSPPAAAVYMMADEVVGPDTHLKAKADMLIKFYKYDEIII